MDKQTLIIVLLAILVIGGGAYAILSLGNQSNNEGLTPTPTVTTTATPTQTAVPTTIAPTATPTVTVTPSLTTPTPTPTAAPKVKAVWLKDTYTGPTRKYVYTMTIPGASTIASIASDRTYFTISIPKGTLRIDQWQGGEPSPVAYKNSSYTTLNGKLGTFYRVVEKTSGNIRYAQTKPKTSGHCYGIDESLTVSAPCGDWVMWVVTDPHEPETTFYATCKSTDTATCDSIMKSMTVAKY